MQTFLLPLCKKTPHFQIVQWSFTKHVFVIKQAARPWWKGWNDLLLNPHLLPPFSPFCLTNSKTKHLTVFLHPSFFPFGCLFVWPAAEQMKYMSRFSTNYREAVHFFILKAGGVSQTWACKIIKAGRWSKGKMKVGQRKWGNFCSMPGLSQRQQSSRQSRGQNKTDKKTEYCRADYRKQSQTYSSAGDE